MLFCAMRFPPLVPAFIKLLAKGEVVSDIFHHNAFCISGACFYHLDYETRTPQGTTQQVQDRLIQMQHLIENIS